MKSAEHNSTVSRSQNQAKPFFAKSNMALPGNDRVPFFSGKAAIQTKLTVGQPNDIYEKEADATADRVVRRMNQPGPDIERKEEASAPSITPFVQTKCDHCEKEEKLQKQEEEDTGVQEKRLQTKPIFESNAEQGEEKGIQRKCSECAKEEKLQKKSEAPGPAASPSIEHSINATKGSGAPLPAETQTAMESSFDADFSNVRIHNNSTATDLNKNLHAQAFTHGSDIYFNSGKYDTSSTAGNHLLAHELTHVVQQGGAGSPATLAKKRIQRVSEYYWEPPSWNGTQEHKKIFKEIKGNVVTEAPIPNAKTDSGSWGANSSAGDGKSGQADLYTSKPGNVIMGLYFLSQTQPTDMPPRGTKLNGSPFLGERAPVRYIDLINKKVRVVKTKEAPASISLGELKPINSLKADAGLKQLAAYKRGIEIARGYVNLQSPTDQWQLSAPDSMSEANLNAIVPDRFKKNASKPFSENCILKGPQVAGGQFTGSRLKETRPIEARLVAVADKTRPGIMVYAWIPKVRPILKELPRRIVKLGKDVTDYIKNPLKAPLKPKAPAVSKKEIPGAKPAISPAPTATATLTKVQAPVQASKLKIQKKDEEYFDLKTWEAHRKKLIKDFKAIKTTKDYKEAMFNTQTMSAHKLIERHLEIPQPTYTEDEKTTNADLKSISFWSSPLAGVFGFFKKLLGKVFNVVATGYEKLRGWIKGIAAKFSFNSGKGGLIGSALKAVFNILKTVARIVISKVIDLLKQDIEKAIEGKVNSLLQEAGLEDAVDTIKKLMHPLDTVIAKIEEWFGGIIEKYKAYFEEINKFIQGLSLIVDIVNTIRWVARAIACVSPPLVGCLWALAQEALERIASWIVETCWFRKKIAPIVLKWNFVQQLATKLYVLIKEFLKSILPDTIGDFFFPTEQGKLEPAKESDIQCGGGGAGEGGEGGEPTPEQEEIIKMEQELGEEKFKALLELLQKAKVDAASKMSAENIRQLSESLRNMSVEDIKKMAEAYAKGDPSGVAQNVKDAIQKLANAPKGKPSAAAPLPDLDPAKEEQRQNAEDARQDAEEIAKNLGAPPPTAEQIESSGRPAGILLNQLVVEKNENERLIWLRKRRAVANEALTARLKKQKSVKITDLNVSVHVDQLEVRIKDVARDQQKLQQVTAVLAVTVISSDHPLIAPGTKDKVVHNVLWDPVSQTAIVLHRPTVIKTILDGIARNQPDLQKNEYDFGEFGFKAKLLKYVKTSDKIVELYFLTTQVQDEQAAIFDDKQAKFISVKPGTPFMVKDSLPDKSDQATTVQPKRMEQHASQTAPGETGSDPSKDFANASGIENSINHSRGKGSALPVPVMRQMENSFGTDFSKVRIHDDQTAKSMNHDLQSNAFTHGNDIYFGSDHYNTNTPNGQHLLAHELTHVNQQHKGVTPSVQRESKEQKPFTFDPARETRPPQFIPNTTQTPDRSDSFDVSGLWWFHRQRITEGSKKFHPELRFEFEESIFFNFDSAELPDIEQQLKIDADLTDVNNPGGWLGRASKRKIRVRLLGNASEEGNASYNLALSNKRLKAVAAALKHPNITIVSQQSVFGKDKTVDFRRARRVDIVEDGVSTTPVVSAGDCKETLVRIMSVKSRAATFLDQAALDILTALRQPGDPDSAKARQTVQKWFALSNVKTMSDVSTGLTKISQTLAILDPAKGNLTCQVTGKPPVEDCSEGIGARGSNDPAPNLTICSKMEKFPDEELLETFIHESAHAAGFMKDFAYSYERIFDFIPTKNKLEMPDGYVGVTLELNKVLRDDKIEAPEIGKKDKVKCPPDETTIARGAMALLDRWIGDAQSSVQQLYDKSDPDLLVDHIKTVKTFFDPKFNGSNLKTIEALYARFEELSFPLRGNLEITCIKDLADISNLGGFWEEDSSGFPGSKVFLFPEFFKAASSQEQGALLLGEMLAEASGFIEPKHRKAFALMAQSFNKNQDKNPWRIK